jgi:outer membrane protein OmpA-like peptidoglycan-associated protein
MAKKKSLLLILLFTWVVFCLVWFFSIYKKDQKKTLAAIKPDVIQSQPLAKEVAAVNPASDAAPKDNSVTEIAVPTAAIDSGSVSANASTPPIVAEKATEEVTPPLDTAAALQAVPVTEDNSKAIKKTEGGLNKKLSICYFYNNSDKKIRNFPPHISKKIQAYLARANSKIIITGHTDYTGSAAYNYKLGLQRAERVKQLLIKKGIAAADIEVISMGEEKPVASNKSLKGRAKNRRVEINITLS